MAQISVSQLFKDTHKKLKLSWMAGKSGGANLLTSETVSKPSLALIGHLNFVHPNRVQVLGCAHGLFAATRCSRSQTRDQPLILY